MHDTIAHPNARACSGVSFTKIIIGRHRVDISVSPSVQGKAGLTWATTSRAPAIISRRHSMPTPALYRPAVSGPMTCSSTIRSSWRTFVIGMTPGTTKSFTITYPADYSIPELAGGTVDYTVTLKEIKKRVVPALDDEFAKDTGKADTLDGLRQKLREDPSKNK